MNHDGKKQLYELWIQAWNEDISILDQITDPGCRVHQARFDGKSSDTLKGVESLGQIISEGSKYFSDIEMSLEVGPIIEGDYLSARWNFRGSYQGGMQEAQIKVGQTISFGGIDIFRIDDGKIKEYWVSSDGVYLMQQLGMC